MNEDYCDYKLSLALKECGFDEPCIAQWACEPDGKPILLGSTAFVFSNAELKGRDVTAPLLFHAQKWLREIWRIHVYPTLESVNEAVYDCKVVYLRKEAYRLNKRYSNYNQALSEGIKSALKLIKKGE